MNRDDELSIRQIIDLTYRYAAGIDHRDWVMFADCFAHPICRFDFSSFSGTPPNEMTGVAFAERLTATNGNFDTTQHLMSNHRITITGSTAAEATYELQAQHWFSPTTMAELGHRGETGWCILGGHYTASVVREADDRWRYRSLRLDVRWHTGDMAVFALARFRPPAPRPNSAE